MIIGKLPDSEAKAKPSIPPILTFPNSFGEGVPYGDPYSVQGWHSPYNSEEHIKLRKAMRSFISNEIERFVDQWEDRNKAPPRELIKNCADQWWLCLWLGFWPKEFVPETVVCGVTLREPDAFHEETMYDELSKLGTAAVTWAITWGTEVGLSPVIKFGSKELKDRIVGPCLTLSRRGFERNFILI